MKTNVSINLSDEQRATIHANFYGGKKGLISRKDVNAICQAAITDWLVNRNSGPQERDSLLDTAMDTDERQAVRDALDEVDVAEVMRQNELLLARVNRLQFLLDTNSRGSR